MMPPTIDSMGNENVSNPKTHDAIAIELVALDGKMDPAENEWESDCRRQNATPHDQPVGRTALSAATPNEPIDHKGVKQAPSPGQLDC